MQMHHLNCGACMGGQTPGVGPATLACHCLLVETQAGPALVGTGTVSGDPL